MTTPTATAAERFRDAVLAQDVDALAALLAADVVFRSPAVHRPYEGRDATMVLLRSVVRVFEDFAYDREYAEPGGGGHVLLFRARVGDREVQGIDLLETDGDLVTSLTVMIRPLSGLEAVVEAMGRVIPEVMAEARRAQEAQ